MSVTATSTDKNPQKKPSLERSSASTTPKTPNTKTDEIPRLQPELAKDLVRFFKLLSDETRLRILFCLYQTDELHVRALCELLKLSQPAVSHHLGMLRTAGIVEPRREGKHNFYRILSGNCQDLLAMVFDSIPSDREATLDDLDLSYRPTRPR